MLEQAGGLSIEDQRRLLDTLRARLAAGERLERAADRHGLDLFLSLAGTAHSDTASVSSDKYSHLADAYADQD